MRRSSFHYLCAALLLLALGCQTDGTAEPSSPPAEVEAARAPLVLWPGVRVKELRPQPEFAGVEFTLKSHYADRRDHRLRALTARVVGAHAVDLEAPPGGGPPGVYTVFELEPLRDLCHQAEQPTSGRVSVLAYGGTLGTRTSASEWTPRLPVGREAAFVLEQHGGEYLLGAGAADVYPLAAGPAGASARAYGGQVVSLAELAEVCR